ncbi:MAG: selenide, water dikinase SelD [Acidobacteriota bacterium]
MEREDDPLARRRRARPREVILVGGGHAHVQVLKALAMRPLPDARLTVVVDRPVAVYSGMVPGYVAGQYAAHELEIDVVPLARRAGARVVLAAATRVDAAARRLYVDGRAPLSYDLASFDIGSVVAGTDLPGVREHALPTRPIVQFVDRVDEVAARAERAEGRFRVVVVGGGAGGVEVAFTLRERLRAIETRRGLALEVTLVFDGDHVLAGSAEAMVHKVEAAARRVGITLCPRRRVVAAEADRVVLRATDRDGDAQEKHEELPCDALLWVTGAAAQGVFTASGLPTDRRGFVRVRSTLQVEGHDELLAAGDCASLIDHPWVPKAGVYAVRQGPYLTEALRRLLDGRRPRVYQPQRDFLALLNLGDGSAIGAKWGRAFEGRWVMRLKDWIDRRFMVKFQVLAPDGTLQDDEFPPMAEMDALCGGCAAKVGQSVLERALERAEHLDLDGDPDPDVDSESADGQRDDLVLGLGQADDAAAFRTPRGDVVVQSVDSFRAFTDDPWLVGRVAAVNAASDLLATGAAPRHALALVTLPEALDDAEAEETLAQILAGMRAGLRPLGAVLLGGHTTTGAELQVGLSIDGLPFTRDDPAGANDLLTLDGGRPGDVLLLTKPLGTGVILHADMAGRARGPWLEACIAAMLRTNADAAQTAAAHGARAATDITGFGLLGHCGELARRSGTTAVVSLGAVPALPGALELLARGERSTFHAQNARARRGVHVDPVLDHTGDARPALALLADPQTSGGLLIAVDAARADAALAAIRAGGDPEAAHIGHLAPLRDDGAPLAVVA